ncbi:hypothetical protein KA005_19575, partial [bacterium]|nr:hypothetical protein [bacterium]
MDKKTLLALVFIGLILVLWPWYMKNVVGVKEPTEPEKTGIEDSTHDEQDITGIVPPQKPGDNGITGEGTDYTFQGSKDEEKGKLGDKIIPVESAIPDTIITVETAFIKAKLSSLGGGTIVSWKLKKHLGKESEDGTREWAEMIPQNKVLDPDPLPKWHNLGIVFGNKAIDLREINFSVEKIPWHIENSDTIYQKVVFSKALEGGRVIKEFIIPYNSYTIDMNVYIESLSP